MSTQQSDLISLPQLAASLGVSYWSVWTWAKEGKIAVVRLPSGRIKVPTWEAERLRTITPAKSEEAVPA